MKKQHYVFRTLITIILTAIITCTITTLTIYGKKDKNKTTEQAISQAMKSDALDMKLKLILCIQLMKRIIKIIFLLK